MREFLQQEDKRHTKSRRRGAKGERVLEQCLLRQWYYCVFVRMDERCERGNGQDSEHGWRVSKGQPAMRYEQVKTGDGGWLLVPSLVASTAIGVDSRLEAVVVVSVLGRRDAPIVTGA